MLLLLLLSACRTPGGPGGSGPPPIPPYETLATMHNDRVDRVRQVHARGVIELRWTDEDGRHFEQGDADMWMIPPRLTALQISKFGERIMWLGSDDAACWVFDFRGGETTLLVDPAWDPAAMNREVPIEPTILLALAGLAPVPQTARADVVYDPKRGAYVLAGEWRGHPMRIYLDRGGLLPVRAEILDGEGRVLVASTMKLSRYDRVRIAGAPPGAGPRFPTLVDVSGTDGRLRILLSLPDPSDGDMRPELFDLDWLKERFRPDRVEGMVPPSDAGP